MVMVKTSLSTIGSPLLVPTSFQLSSPRESPGSLRTFLPCLTESSGTEWLLGLSPSPWQVLPGWSGVKMRISSFSKASLRVHLKEGWSEVGASSKDLAVSGVCWPYGGDCFYAEGVATSRQ